LGKRPENFDRAYELTDQKSSVSVHAHRSEKAKHRLIENAAATRLFRQSQSRSSKGFHQEEENPFRQHKVCEIVYTMLVDESIVGEQPV
jgi:hypothetical protein